MFVRIMGTGRSILLPLASERLAISPFQSLCYAKLTTGWLQLHVEHTDMRVVSILSFNSLQLSKSSHLAKCQTIPLSKLEPELTL